MKRHIETRDVTRRGSRGLKIRSVTAIQFEHVLNKKEVEGDKSNSS